MSLIFVTNFSRIVVIIGELRIICGALFPDKGYVAPMGDQTTVASSLGARAPLVGAKEQVPRCKPHLQDVFFVAWILLIGTQTHSACENHEHKVL
jgi:hypothetical protein